LLQQQLAQVLPKLTFKIVTNATELGERVASSQTTQAQWQTKWLHHHNHTTSPSNNIAQNSEENLAHFARICITSNGIDS